MKQHHHPSVGVDDMSLYIPHLYLPVRELAYKRNIDPGKLEKGLGLVNMAIPDSDEDAVTMAAEALIELVEKNDLGPSDIDKIYVGTESSIDGSKPIASYLLGILRKYYETQGIDPAALRRCDAIDMTFACIGAIDAMQLCLDHLRLHPEKKAIVISTDHAKYDLNSPGEYTQGAGAVGLLLTANPRILEIQPTFGVSTECVHDFYKPLRKKVRHEDIVSQNGIDIHRLGREVYTVHSETPIYDGHFSNQCYTERITEAFEHYSEQGGDSIEHLFDTWSSLVFHLPYAFHARRILTGLYFDYLKKTGRWESFRQSEGIAEQGEADNKALLKAIAKTDSYRQFVQEKIASGERASALIGNIYTGSIFLSLISTLSDESVDLSGKQIGMIAYGSGSKSKVFSARVVPDYQNSVRDIELDEKLADRQRIQFWEYEYLHKGKLLVNLDSVSRKVFHTASGWQETNRFAREYTIV